MTSATWPPGVRRLAAKYMKDPIQVRVGSMDLVACHNVEQRLEQIDERQRKERLFYFLKHEFDARRDKVMVFVEKKARVLLCNYCSCTMYGYK